ncbi:MULTISPECIES: hypothetical protein [unclassified Streptomyces]|uniref:hypothetical protein n=1 Tax=unclassified Streptomyces TaxID=2593676 RepID=UPI002E819E1C|nr:hypothetical protein [Streptomyces sp. NBC_00589]WTI38168.1 hypothetical protein OIC96_25870 [Streptomyces sp. NBC_00775]WUB28153.1 hypothetical protein OHA51_23865 [Streptomyces sp. NBC_00589]
MITRVSHTVSDSGPAGFTLALEVAHELHAPAARAPEVAVPQMMGLRISAAHPHLRKVQLRRLNALSALPS